MRIGRNRILPILFFVLLPVIETACQTLELRDSNSSVRFFIRNFGVTVEGRVRGLTGYVVLNKDSSALSHFSATVRTETVDTGIDLRNRHLRQSSYFDAVRHPEIRLVSRAITKKTETEWQALADITIKGITQQISIPFSVEKSESGFRLKGKFNLNRRHFGVGGASISLSDEVAIVIDAVAVVVPQPN